MTASLSRRLLRWTAPLAAGLGFLLFLAVSVYVYFRTVPSGIGSLIGDGLKSSMVRAFALDYVFRMLLPLYLTAALGMFLFGLLWGSLWRKGWQKHWTFGEGFALALSSLFWIHTLLWWQVPTALWFNPILRHLPLWLDFLLLLALSFTYPIYWALRWIPAHWKRACLLAGWFGAWSVLVWAPRVLPRLHVPPRGGTQKTKVLLLGIDGLRSDTGLEITRNWVGQPYRYVYTPIPATRLLWNILWGGNPLYYTVGHVMPGEDEFTPNNEPPLLKAARLKGWKPRFYIDDGGTISLTLRSAGFDEVLMPAVGWENFACSNLSGGLPLFAVWENWFRAFPTTNPWAPLDGGLRETLRLGRGSGLVMFHSCLAHQPIFLRREELAPMKRWWALAPKDYEPVAARWLVNQKQFDSNDDRTNSFTAYQIRMASIAKAWESIWNELDKDPDYRGATRVLFSDHGERFYHVGEHFQLSGVHGFNLDPWEVRPMFLVAGPGFPDRPTAPDASCTVSLVNLRDAMASSILEDRNIQKSDLPIKGDFAPMRYHTLNLKDFIDLPDVYKEVKKEELKAHAYIGPKGFWYMTYGKSAAERADEVSIAEGKLDHLVVYKPLKAGGAHRFVYDGFQMVSWDEVTQADFEKERAKVERLLGPIPNLAGTEELK